MKLLLWISAIAMAALLAVGKIFGFENIFPGGSAAFYLVLPLYIIIILSYVLFVLALTRTVVERETGIPLIRKAFRPLFNVQEDDDDADLKKQINTLLLHISDKVVDLNDRRRIVKLAVFGGILSLLAFAITVHLMAAWNEGFCGYIPLVGMMFIFFNGTLFYLKCGLPGDVLLIAAGFKKDPTASHGHGTAHGKVHEIKSELEQSVRDTIQILGNVGDTITNVILGYFMAVIIISDLNAFVPTWGVNENLYWTLILNGLGYYLWSVFAKMRINPARWRAIWILFLGLTFGSMWYQHLVHPISLAGVHVSNLTFFLLATGAVTLFIGWMKLFGVLGDNSHSAHGGGHAGGGHGHGHGFPWGTFITVGGIIVAAAVLGVFLLVVFTGATPRSGKNIASSFDHGFGDGPRDAKNKWELAKDPKNQDCPVAELFLRGQEGCNEANRSVEMIDGRTGKHQTVFPHGATVNPEANSGTAPQSVEPDKKKPAKPSPLTKVIPDQPGQAPHCSGDIDHDGPMCQFQGGDCYNARADRWNVPTSQIYTIRADNKPVHELPTIYARKNSTVQLCVQYPFGNPRHYRVAFLPFDSGQHYDPDQTIQLSKYDLKKGTKIKVDQQITGKKGGILWLITPPLGSDIQVFVDTDPA